MISAGGQAGWLAALTIWRATAGGEGKRLGSRTTARISFTRGRGRERVVRVESGAEIVADTEPSLYENRLQTRAGRHDTQTCVTKSRASSSCAVPAPDLTNSGCLARAKPYR